jgi:hypothetical protein
MITSTYSIRVYYTYKTVYTRGQVYKEAINHPVYSIYHSDTTEETYLAVYDIDSKSHAMAVEDLLFEIIRDNGGTPLS